MDERWKESRTGCPAFLSKYIVIGRGPMNRKPNILATFLVLALALALTACGAGGDRVERFAESAPGSGENIAIPGYEKLSFAAGKTAQTVNLKNPPENACTFVLTLTLEGGEILWTGKALSPARRSPASR